MKDRSYSVSELSRYLSGLFSEDYLLRNLTVSGEISNLKYHSSGNIFFTLKDSASQLSAVLFAGDRAGLRFRLEDGMKVLCSGRVSVYEKGGSYQLYVKSVRSDGLGELYLLYEELKRKLAEMGFFDPAYKRALPRYARRIGIVTAKTGAAVRDIIQIARRRNPYVELWLYPAKVQGEGAAESVSEGIETLDRLGLDVLIVGRGGGSIEDLWAFNEERVAEAIFHADTPIISAVGHETDTTIADYVADRRAPTPSAAAELAVFELSSFYEDLKQRESSFLSLMREKLLKERQSVERREYRLRALSPETKLLRLRQRLMGAEEELRKQMKERIRGERTRLQAYRGLSGWMEKRLSGERQRLELLTERLDAASPGRRLAGGWSFLSEEGGRRIRSVSEIRPGSLLVNQIADGKIISRVERVEGRVVPEKDDSAPGQHGERAGFPADGP